MAKDKTKAELKVELEEKTKELERLKNIEQKYKDSQEKRWKLNKELENSISKTILDNKDKEIQDLRNQMKGLVPKKEMEKFNKYIEGLQPVLNDYIAAYQSTLKSFEGSLELAKQAEKDIRQKFGGKE